MIIVIAMTLVGFCLGGLFEQKVSRKDAEKFTRCRYCRAAHDRQNHEGIEEWNGTD